MRLLLSGLLALAALASDALATPRVLIGVGLSAEPGEGVAVASVERGSPAAAAGLEPGDRILAVSQEVVASPEEVSAALTPRAETVALLHVQRGDAGFFAPVRPVRSPDPARDAALFPYQQAIVEPVSALSAEIAGRTYPVLERAEVFNWMNAFGVSSPAGRVAFRARLARCADLESLSGLIEQPNADLLYSMTSVRSALFDFDAAAAERAVCERYMAEQELSWSSPQVVIAGRFVNDAEAKVSEGGLVLLVDAALFDHGHVTLGAQLWSAFRLLEGAGLITE